MAEIDLAVIDLSQFPKEFDGDYFHHPDVVKLREACEEWGFFRVVNHGFPPDLLQKVLSVSRDLLSRPLEYKEKVPTYNTLKYNPLHEYIIFLAMPNPDLTQEISRKIWPEEGNSFFSEVIDAYGVLISDLAITITKFLIAALGLDPRAFYQSNFGKCTPDLFISSFNFLEHKCVGDEALVSHADTGVVTIVYNDDKEGLEVRSKQGEWMNVKPTPDSFIVNVGDSMKVWSNGRYRSAHHRVLFKGWKNRLSLPLFLNFPYEEPIYALEELVDKDNPRRYKPYTFSELVIEVKNNKSGGELYEAVERVARII